MRRAAQSPVGPPPVADGRPATPADAAAAALPRPDRAVFSVGGTIYRRRHVVVAARVRGDWDELVRGADEELACLARAARDDPLEPGAVQGAAAAFRRAEGLLAAEDLEAWLAARDVTAADWLAHVRGELLREAWRGELDGMVRAKEPASAAELGRAVWTRGICLGALSELADRLAAEAAASATLAPPAPGGAGTEADAASLAAGRAAEERLVAQATTDAALAREIEAHRVAWTSVACAVLVHADLDVLREAALCITADGLALDAAAAESGAELRRATLAVGELPPELGMRLFAAEPGVLLEPARVDGEGWLVLVEAKTTPSAADPALRERAGALIAARERARAVDAWVRWHDRL